MLLGRKAMTNLDSILKSRDITLPTKVQSYGWIWELNYKESWAPKNWCFWTVVLEKTLESPLDCREIKPVHPKWNQSEYSLERLMLKLKFQYFGHLMWRTDSLGKTLMLGKIEGRRRRDEKEKERMRWLDDITNPMDMSLSKLQELRAAVHGVTKSWAWLRDWTELNWTEWRVVVIWKVILWSPD